MNTECAETIAHYRNVREKQHFSKQANEHKNARQMRQKAYGKNACKSVNNKRNVANTATRTVAKTDSSGAPT